MSINYFNIKLKTNQKYVFKPKNSDLISVGKNQVFGGVLHSLPVAIGEDYFGCKAVYVSTLLLEKLYENEETEITFEILSSGKTKIAEFDFMKKDKVIAKSYSIFGKKSFPVSRQIAKMKEIPDPNSVPWHEPVFSNGEDVLSTINKKFIKDSNNKMLCFMEIKDLRSSDNCFQAIVSDWGACMVASAAKIPSFAYTIDLKTFFCNNENDAKQAWVQTDFSTISNGFISLDGKIFSPEGLLMSCFNSTLNPVAL